MNYFAPILLAEDDEDDIFIMRRALRSAGISNPLQIVRNGHEVIQYLTGEGPYTDRQQYPWPCLLMLDLRMPLMDGFDVLTWLQRRHRPKDLLAVILSGSKEEADMLRASQLGADAYFVKPDAYEDLVGIVRRLYQRLDQMPEIPAWLIPPGEQPRL